MPASNDAEAALAALSSLTDPTRKRLYDYVQEERRAVGRDEAAEAVAISRSLAAYHLDRLVESGLLHAHYERPAGRVGPGAGRPAKLYTRRTEAVEVSVPRRDYQLAARAFADALVTGLPGDPATVLRSASQRLGHDLVGEATAGDEGTDKSLTGLLRTLGYEPFLDDTNAIRLGNCLFAELVDHQRELTCTMNLGLIEGALDAIGDKHHRAELDPGNRRCCVAIQPVDASDEVRSEKRVSEDDEAELRRRASRFLDLHDREHEAAPTGEGAHELVTQFRDVFVDGLVSGLCREGALELFEDALKIHPGGHIARTTQAEPGELA